MKKSLSVFSLIILSLGVTAQVSLPYYTGFDSPGERSGWDEYRKGATNPNNQWQITSVGPLSPPDALYHGYPVGGTTPTDDWYVSPEFSFPNGGMIDSVWNAFSGFGTPMAGDTVAIYLLTGDQDPDLATSVTMLFNYADTNYVNDNNWHVNTDIIIPATNEPAFIAFRYTTTVNWLDVKFDNLYISGDSTMSTNTNAAVQRTTSIYPNPTRDYLSLDIPAGLNVKNIEIINMSGIKVKAERYNGGRLDVSELPAEQYIVRMHTSEGIQSHKVVIMQ